MYKFAQKVVKFRIPILIIALILLIPAAIGYIGTGINYDILSYFRQGFIVWRGLNLPFLGTIREVLRIWHSG